MMPYCTLNNIIIINNTGTGVELTLCYVHGVLVFVFTVMEGVHCKQMGGVIDCMCRPCLCPITLAKINVVLCYFYLLH